MEITIKKVLDELLISKKFDVNLAKKVSDFRINFMTSSEEHMKFFGGNLMGVNRVRFTEVDINRFLDDVVAVNLIDLDTSIKTITTINHSFKISGDPVNLLWFYMMYKFMTSPLLDEKKRHKASIDVALIFNYRTIAALLAHYFKYPIDTQTAQAVYERLSGRYLIKKLGTWQDVFNYRAEEFISKESPHYKSILKFTDDKAIVSAINDYQSRIKDTLKNIYAEFIIVKEEGTKIKSSSSTIIDADGEEVIKDRIHGLDNYLNYINDVITHEETFIKEELIEVIEDVVVTVQIRPFRNVLKWISHEIIGKHREIILEFVHLSLVIAFNYLLKHEHDVHHSRDIIFLTTKLKGYILSSRENEEDLNKLRTIGNKIINLSVGKSSEQSVASLRNSLFLYICIRAFTKKAYT